MRAMKRRHSCACALGAVARPVPRPSARETGAAPPPATAASPRPLRTAGLEERSDAAGCGAWLAALGATRLLLLLWRRLLLLLLERALARAARRLAAAAVGRAL